MKNLAKILAFVTGITFTSESLSQKQNYVVNETEKKELREISSLFEHYKNKQESIKDDFKEKIKKYDSIAKQNNYDSLQIYLNDISLFLNKKQVLDTLSEGFYKSKGPLGKNIIVNISNYECKDCQGRYYNEKKLNPKQFLALRNSAYFKINNFLHSKLNGKERKMFVFKPIIFRHEHLSPDVYKYILVWKINYNENKFNLRKNPPKKYEKAVSKLISEIPKEINPVLFEGE